MSGPIVRKYGFPNFEKIFGDRKLEHGVEEGEDASPAASAEVTSSAPSKPQATPAPPKEADKP